MKNIYKFEVEIEIDTEKTIGCYIEKDKSTFLNSILRYGLHYDDLENTVKIINVKEI